MKKILTTLLIVVLWSNTTYANIKNIGNGISISLPNGYHYFDITLKQIVSRFPSIDISDFTSSELGIGANAKLVILANNKKTIKLVNDISTVSGLAKLTEDYWEPFLSLEEDPAFMKIIKSYTKKNFAKIDLDNASDEEWQIILITVLNDKKFLKKIDQYIRPFIDKFKSDYEFDKITVIFIGDKKLEFANELKKLSISEAKNLLLEGIKTMSKEDPAFKIYKDFKYKIGKNPKGNLYLYSNDISYLDRDPLFKQLKYIKKSDTILTTDNEKLVTISSQCIKKCNSTDFLQILGPTNLYKEFVNNQIKTPIIKNNSDIVSQLKKLNDLYKSGVLTKEEFTKAKSKILKTEEKLSKKINKELNENDYFELLYYPNENKINEWKRFKNSLSEYNAWIEIRNKTFNRWSYSWRGRSTLEQALKQGFSACNERVKNRPKSDFRKSDLCIPIFINISGKVRKTTNEEKIEYTEEYYGKEISDKFFKKNSWVLE